MEDDGLLGEFGDFDIDTSVADARAARIAAARDQAKLYSAKIEEPGWFHDPKEAARLKEPNRATLFSLHQLYFQQEWVKVVETGLDLLRDGIREEMETMDMVMRASQKAGDKTDSKKDQVVEIAKRWREFTTQPSICHVSAQILHSASSPAPLSSSAPPSLAREALCASLASLRLNRAQPPFLTTLEQILSSTEPLLSSALQDRSLATVKRKQLASAIENLELSEIERETLETVLGMHGEEKDVEEDAGRDVRSL